jgi:hypothetical protein
VETEGKGQEDEDGDRGGWVPSEGPRWSPGGADGPPRQPAHAPTTLAVGGAGKREIRDCRLKTT